MNTGDIPWIEHLAESKSHRIVFPAPFLKTVFYGGLVAGYRDILAAVDKLVGPMRVPAGAYRELLVGNLCSHVVRLLSIDPKHADEQIQAGMKIAVVFSNEAVSEPPGLGAGDGLMWTGENTPA